MSVNDSMAAEFLAMSSSAYAAYAANLLIEKQPEIQAKFGDSAFHDWKAHFQQRVMELSAALSENEPRLFVSMITWAGSAFQARELSQDLLKISLECLREVLDEELPESSREEPRRFINAAMDSLQSVEDKRPGLDPSLPNRIDPQAKLAMKYLKTVLEGDSRTAINLVVNAVEKGLPVEDVIEHVLLAAQREVGEMWHQAEISVAEEHYVTSTTRRALAILCHQAETKPSTGFKVVSGAVAQNVHDVGIQAVSDLFEIAGWKVVCLGGNTPPFEFAEAVKCFDADLVLVSAALSTQLKTVRATIDAIRNLPDDYKVMVGGTAFRETPDLWKQLGADGYADTISGALTTGSELMQS